MSIHLAMSYLLALCCTLMVVQMTIADETDDNDNFIAQGCCLYTAQQYAALFGSAPNTSVSSTNSTSRRKRAYAQDLGASTYFYKWQFPIPYVFDSSMSASDQAATLAMMQLYQNNTCVRYSTENKFNQTLLRFISTNTGPNDGCYASFGRIYNATEQVQANGGLLCDPPGYGAYQMACHDMMHTLGMMHEMTRYDRDNYVIVNSSNVVADHVSDYAKLPITAAFTYGNEYDYGSMLHYSGYQYALNTSIPVMTTIDPNYQHSMKSGHRVNSFYDFLIVNQYYNCLDICNNSPTQCSNGGYKNPNNCSQCICPSGFGGPTCLAVASSDFATCQGGYLTANTNWQNLTVTMPSQTQPNGIPSYCHWIIRSNTFQNVQVRIVAMNGAPCIDDCSDNGVEMKIRTGGNDHYRRTGYRFCCANQLNTVFTSETPQVPVIATTLGNTVSFTLQYRLAQGPPPPPPPPPYGNGNGGGYGSGNGNGGPPPPPPPPPPYGGGNGGGYGSGNGNGGPPPFGDGNNGGNGSGGPPHSK